MKKLLPLAFACPLLLPVTALAAPPVSDDTAGQLAKDISAQMDIILDKMDSARLENPVTVTPDGDGYEVSIPTITANLRGGETVRTGIIKARLTPQEGDSYRFSLTLPSPLLTVFDLTQVPAAVATLAGHDITGVWDDRLKTVTQLNATLRGARLADGEGKRTMLSLDQIRLTADNSVDGAGKLNGNTVLSVSAAHGYNRQQQEVFSLGGFGFSYIIRGADYEALRAMRTAASATSEDKPARPQFGDMLARLGRIGGESAMAFVGRDLQLRDINATGASTQTSVWSMALVRLSLNSASSTDGLTSGTLSYRHEGLQVSPAPNAAVRELLPASLELAGQLDRLPVGKLFALLNETPATPTVTKDGQPAAAPSPWDRTRQELETAGTTLTVSKLSYSAPHLTSGTSGQFKASGSAKWGAVGELNTRINGLDEVVDRFTAMTAPADHAGGKPQPQADPNIQSAMMGLSMLQSFGQQVKDASPSARTYKLELGADGTLRLNGTDFSALMGMGRGMAAGSPPQVRE